MKAVILAGGFGTRMFEKTKFKPKPLVEIGKMPILWHIMKCFASYNVNDFIVCCGYKGDLIKKYFSEIKESWNISLIDTGLNTMTGGRLKRVKKYVENETFCFTYGDTLNNLKINELITFHKNCKTLATVTACHPPEKYGILELENDKVIDFREKPPREGEWVNGGYFVLEPEIFDYIKDDTTVWEKEPLKKLAVQGQLSAFKHTGFYKPMDTISDRNFLETLWNSNEAPWKVWN